MEEDQGLPVDDRYGLATSNHRTVSGENTEIIEGP